MMGDIGSKGLIREGLTWQAQERGLYSVGNVEPLNYLRREAVTFQYVFGGD